MFETLREHDLHQEIKLGLYFNAEMLLRPNASGNFTSAYMTENNAAKSGQEVVERMLALWQDTDLVSMDDVLAVNDTSAMRYLKKVS